MRRSALWLSTWLGLWPEFGFEAIFRSRGFCFNASQNAAFKYLSSYADQRLRSCSFRIVIAISDVLNLNVRI